MSVFREGQGGSTCLPPTPVCNYFCIAIIFAMQLFLHCSYLCNAFLFAVQSLLQCNSWASRETSLGEGRDMRSRRPSVRRRAAIRVGVQISVEGDSFRKAIIFAVTA